MLASENEFFVICAIFHFHGGHKGCPFGHGDLKKTSKGLLGIRPPAAGFAVGQVCKDQKETFQSVLVVSLVEQNER